MLKIIIIKFRVHLHKKNCSNRVRMICLGVFSQAAIYLDFIGINSHISSDNFLKLVKNKTMYYKNVLRMSVIKIIIFVSYVNLGVFSALEDFCTENCNVIYEPVSRRFAGFGDCTPISALPTV